MPENRDVEDVEFRGWAVVVISSEAAVDIYAAMSFANQNKCKCVQTLGPPGAVDTLSSVVAEGGGIGGRAYVGGRCIEPLRVVLHGAI